jgi:hypothetical protein
MSIASVAALLSFGSTASNMPHLLAKLAPASGQSMVDSGGALFVDASRVVRVTIYREGVNREGPYKKENVFSALSKTCTIRQVKSFVGVLNQELRSAMPVKKPTRPFFNTAIRYWRDDGSSQTVFFFFDTKSNSQKINIDEKEYSISATFDNKIVDFARAECGQKWDYL